LIGPSQEKTETFETPTKLKFPLEHVNPLAHLYMYRERERERERNIEEKRRTTFEQRIWD